MLLPPQVQHAKRFSHGVGDQFGKTDKKLSATNIDHRGHLGVKLAIAGLNLNPSSADFDSILRKAI
ncbi:MAG: hypothetical protein HY010_09260 [Acidobacteria bacterium]|nr:hypothetical protein [Acidobacteriota bacterium]